MVNDLPALNKHFQPGGGLCVTAVPAFSDNYIWLIHSPRHPQRVVAVDPGDAQTVIVELEKHGLQLAAIFVTHHHDDHIGGVAGLIDAYSVPVFGCTSEHFQVNLLEVSEGQSVNLTELGLKFDVLNIPGHTQNHIAFTGHGSTFCGDTLFSAGCGRLFEGTPQQMTSSLARLGRLPPSTQLYCAHEYTVSNLNFATAVEPTNQIIQRHLVKAKSLRQQNLPTVPTTVALESEINPFLRLNVPTVRQAACNYAGKVLDEESDVFAALRHWKDRFNSSYLGSKTAPSNMEK